MEFRGGLWRIILARGGLVKIHRTLVESRGLRWTVAKHGGLWRSPPDFLSLVIKLLKIISILLFKDSFDVRYVDIYCGLNQITK